METVPIQGTEKEREYLFAQIEKLQAELEKHRQQGGIAMKCGHPIQCAYAQAKIDGGNGCSMCDLQTELERHRWIPVSERLPLNSDRLLAFGKDGYGYKIVVATNFDLRFKKFRILNKVTHWQPIILPALAGKGGE